jgi:Na+-translocating ferredoxin:NAD+ oxidoreductase RnfE subunit
MDSNKSKQGVSVKEIEQFTKKHRTEVFLSLNFLLATLFSFVFFGVGITITLAGVGGILGAFLPGKVEKLGKVIFGFIFKQETMTQLILGVVSLILAIFIPPLTFLLMGLFGGQCLRYFSSTRHA